MDLVMLRYVGDDRQQVPKLSRVVEPDELVGVPRDVFEQYAWPESQWRRVDDGGKGQGDQAGAKTRKAGQQNA